MQLKYVLSTANAFTGRPQHDWGKCKQSYLQHWAASVAMCWVFNSTALHTSDVPCSSAMIQWSVGERRGLVGRRASSYTKQRASVGYKSIIQIKRLTDKTRSSRFDLLTMKNKAYSVTSCEHLQPYTPSTETYCGADETCICVGCHPTLSRLHPGRNKPLLVGRLVCMYVLALYFVNQRRLWLCSSGGICD